MPLFALTMMAGLVLLLLMVAASLAIGARNIPLDAVVASLGGRHVGPDSVIVMEARLPRTLAGLFSGAALGLSGALVQALSRNPLSEPGLLGINAGAGLAVSLAVMLIGVTSPAALFVWGFAGALIAATLVFAVGTAGGGRSDPSHFILAGMALGAVMAGVSSALSLLNPATFDRMRFWMAGTLDIGDLSLALAVLPVLAVGTVAALLLARSLNALALGEDVATALGARPALVQAAGIALVALLCGTTTAMTGPIAFVALMVPHVARWLAGQDMRHVLPLSMILAPVLLLAADIIGRVIVAGELRVSIVTAFLGAPVLIWMARRHHVD
jgi:iron complex transport system permease protein